MSTKRRSYFRVGCSVAREPWDNDVVATMVRLSAYMIDRWARDGLTAEEACRIVLKPAEMMAISGRCRRDVAATLLGRLADVVSMSVEHHRDVTEIFWPKFAEFQGLRNLEPPIPRRRMPESASAPASAPASALKNTMSASETPTVVDVFEHWKQSTGRTRCALDPKRRRLITMALKLYDVETLKRCIDGYKLSPHHQGQNDRHTRYDDLEIMLRDAKHIEAGLSFHNPVTVRPAGNGHLSPPGPVVPGVKETRAILERLRG